MSKEAMTLALEALNKLTDAAGGFSVSGVYFNEGVWEQECLNAAYDAIKALEEALAKQEQGEPDDLTIAYMAGLNRGKDLAPQPAQKPLTDEEIGAILEGVNAYGTRLYTFARAIEAAHGIKE